MVCGTTALLQQLACGGCYSRTEQYSVGARSCRVREKVFADELLVQQRESARGGRFCVVSPWRRVSGAGSVQHLVERASRRRRVAVMTTSAGHAIQLVREKSHPCNRLPPLPARVLLGPPPLYATPFKA